MSNLFLPIRILTFTLLFTLLWLGQTNPAHAHRVTVFAWTEGDQIHTESKFGNGKPVSGGKIVVFDDSGQELLTGTTDQEGGFTFVPPTPPPIKIEILAGMGHKNHWIVEAEDEDDHATTNPMETPSKTTPALPQNVLTDNAATLAVTAQEVETIVAKALDQKLAPIHKAIARQEQKQKNSVSDIFAGIGYILGLVGVGAYVHYRKKTNTPK